MLRLALLALWTLAGVTGATGPRAAVAAAAQDVQVQLKAAADPKDVESYRYFYFASPAGKPLDEAVVAFQLHLNFLSTYSEMIPLVFVAGNVVRVDIDELGWDRATLEAAFHVDPFLHRKELLKKDATFEQLWPGGTDTSRFTGTRGQKFGRQTFSVQVKTGQRFSLHAPWLDKGDVQVLRDTLYTEVPVLQAEWFLVQSCRQLSLRNKDDEGLGYFDFLRLADRDAYFKLIALDVKAQARLKKDVRAASEFSGVSVSPRQMLGDESQAGPYWVALDTTDATRKGVAIRQLKDGQFAHQIEEHYGALANRLPVTFICNDKGVRANNAPADAAGFRDDSPLNESRDGRIHNHLACLRCHAGQVLKPIDDHIRKTFGYDVRSPHRPALGDPDRKAAKDLRRQYFSDLTERLEEHQRFFQRAFVRATVTKAFLRGLPAQQACEIYARVYHRYADRPVTLADAARELGVTEKTFKDALLWHKEQRGFLDLRLIPFIADRPLAIQRLTWEDVFELAEEIVLGYLPELRKQ